ncbi:MAG: response regulator [Brevinematales bacterium]
MEYREILIADESSVSGMITRRCFEIAGYRDAKYIFAGTCLEAFSELEKNHSIDLILTDIMSGMDGASFIKKLRSIHPATGRCIIVVSGVEDSSVKIALFKAGADAIIKKPVNPVKVVKIMEGLA